mgnify:FL=1
MYIYRLSHGYEEENIEESRSSIQPFFRKGWMLRNIKDQRKFLSEVFDQWKISRDFDEFLVLLAQTWIALEDIYIEDVDKYYNTNFFEKKLFFYLLEYGEEILIQNKKFVLLDGYIQATTEYFFWGNPELKIEASEEKGKRLLKKIRKENPGDFIVEWFYSLIFAGPGEYKKFYKKFDVGSRINDVFPLDTEVDHYFRKLADLSRG